MNDDEFLAELVKRGEKADSGYLEFAHLAACLLPGHLVEQLRQLVNGPVWDGDVIGKSLRDELMTLGLAVRVCCGGEQGHTGATYFGFSVLKKFDEIKAGKVAA